MVLLLCAIVINATMVLSVLVWDEDIDKDPAGSYVRSYVQGDDVGSYFADGSIYVEHEWYKIYPETAGFKDTYYLDALGRVYRVEVETWGESDPLGIFLYAKAVIDATAQ
ncbi:MAG: hypothetical protein DRJ36_03275 [Thermoprotei archaeon]|nr:MAG: hypothetical protein DRJ36_03275 [Thermoprotei archaeon]